MTISNPQGHWGLSPPRSLQDTSMNEIKIEFKPYDNETNISLILPDSINITLKRCHVTFYDINVNHGNKLIDIRYNLTQPCLSRQDKIFVVNITYSIGGGCLLLLIICILCCWYHRSKSRLSIMCYTCGKSRICCKNGQ